MAPARKACPLDRGLAIPNNKTHRIVAIVGTLFSRDVAVLTSAIAFNFLLCLFPLVLVIVSLSQHFEGSRATGAVEMILGELIPFGREAIALTLRSMTRRAQGLEVVSLGLIVFASSGIFIPVEMALNHAWGGGPHRAFWKSRILALLMTVLGGLLSLVSVALTVESRRFGRGFPFLATVGTKGSAAALTYVLFFVVYRLVPQKDVGGRLALRASLWAGTAWEILKYLFVARLAQMNLHAFYGPLALAVALVLWAYVSSLVLILGALIVGPPSRPLVGRRRDRLDRVSPLRNSSKGEA